MKAIGDIVSVMLDGVERIGKVVETGITEISLRIAGENHILTFAESEVINDFVGVKWFGNTTAYEYVELAKDSFFTQEQVDYMLKGVTNETDSPEEAAWAAAMAEQVAIDKETHELSYKLWLDSQISNYQEQIVKLIEVKSTYEICLQEYLRRN